MQRELWQPRLLEDGSREDLDELERLRGSLPPDRVHDTLSGQLDELIRSRHPALPRNEAIAGGKGDRRGVWVYYPWQDRLVRVLERSDFAELRTNRNRNKITREEQAVLARKRVGVVGLSVGLSVVSAMALERSFGAIRLADFDRLDLSNLNRLRAGVHCLGLPKVVIAAREIAELDPFLECACYPDGLTPANVGAFMGGDDGASPLDLVVDECDDLMMKILLRIEARARRIPVVMETSDRGMIDVERFDLEPDRPILHGLLGDVEPEALQDLSAGERREIVLRLVGGIDSLSPRMRLSMGEIGKSLCTWPQLAADVQMGGGIAAETVRRIHLDQFRASGRYFVDPPTVIR